MRKLLLAVLLAVGLASQVRAQGPSVAFVNTAALNAAVAATVIDSVRPTESGIYRFTYAVIITTAGSGGTSPTDLVQLVCPNGIGNNTISSSTFNENQAAGTEVDGSFTCYAAGSTSAAITYAIVDGGTQGTHMIYTLRLRLERLY